MSALVLLTLVSCFLGASEISGRRYDEEAECWVWDSFVGENVYWWEWVDRTRGCLDTGLHFLTVDGECWALGGWCGDEYLNDPWVERGGVNGICPRAWEDSQRSCE